MKICVITNNAWQAEQIERTNIKEIKGIPVFGMTLGYRFDLIIIPAILKAHEDDLFRERLQEWISETLSLCLTKHGKIVYI